jgi:hypothetical protein
MVRLSPSDRVVGQHVKIGEALADQEYVVAGNRGRRGLATIETVALAVRLAVGDGIVKLSAPT